jgi:hypothetical protein
MGGSASIPSQDSCDKESSTGNKESSSKQPQTDATDHDDPDEDEDEEEDEAIVDPVASAYSTLSKQADQNKVRQLKKTFSQQDILQPPLARELGDIAMLETGLALRENKTITAIDLPHQKIKMLGLLFLLQELQDNIALKSLDLSYNFVGTEGIPADELLGDASVACAALAAVVSSDATVIETLRLERSHLASADGVTLGQALATNSSLKTLVLNGNDISNAGASAIGESLSSTSSLLVLDLSNNNIGARGVGGLAGALRSPAASLEVLLLEGNCLGAEGCQIIASALEGNTSLKSIRYCL